jgi:ketosteroid isomerase-like protein
MAKTQRDWLSAWENLRFEAEEYSELDSERVLVLARYSGHGKTSGLDVGQIRAKGAAVFHIRDGKVRRYVRYFDRERAFADLGLAPEGGDP